MECEIIIRQIILKLISNVIYENRNKTIDATQGEFCTNFIINEGIVPVLSQQLTTYDFDDIDEDQINSYKNKTFYGIKKTVVNSWYEIEEPQCPIVDRCAPSMIKTGNYEEIKREDRHEVQNSGFDSGKGSSLISMNIQINVTEKKDKEKIENNKTEEVVLPSYDLKKEDFNDQNSPELELLRTEFENQKIKIMKEKKRAYEEREKQKQEEKEQKIKKKDFNFKKLGFDCNGNIIDIKPLKLSDLKKEFYYPRAGIKKQENPNSPRKKTVKKEKEEIIYNPNTGNGNKTDRNISSYSKQEIKKIQPMGSNYDLIYPEVGVRVTEGKNKKGGNKDFGKKFNKTSREDYDKYLSEYIPNLNASLIKSQLFIKSTQLLDNKEPDTTSDNVNENDIEKNDNFTQVNISRNNPLLENGTLNTSPLRNNYYNNSAHNSVLQSSYLLSNNNIYRTDNFDSIKLSNNKINMSSLKMTLDSIDNLDDGFFDSYLYNHSSNRKKGKPFNSLLINSKVNQTEGNIHEDSAIKLNQEIIKNKNWGNSETSVYKSTEYTRPIKSNFLKELGMNIVMTKLPRSRKFNHLKYKIRKITE